MFFLVLLLILFILNRSKNEQSDVLERFLEYIAIDTTSDRFSEDTPSTKGQIILAKFLASQLEEIGMKDIVLDEEVCILTARLPSNIMSDHEIPTIGFLAHLDTSEECSGENIQPIIHRNYDGRSDIVVNKKEDVVIRFKDNEVLKKYKGQDIITSDGTTLLGSDDKAGIASIVSAMKSIIDEGEDFLHGDIMIGFTPDEEIGRGTQNFNVEKFGADYAYTVDGEGIGELEFETFNAANVKIRINGKSTHPGYAKDKMVSALNVANEFHSMLPEDERAENTEDREGFFHLRSMQGTVVSVEMEYAIRDHDRIIFEERKGVMRRIQEEMNEKYKSEDESEDFEVIEMEIEDFYFNMKEKIEPVYDPVITVALESIQELGFDPVVLPIRGGTDGAFLSYKGLPCPNLSAGGHNFHSRMEYLPIIGLEKSKEVVMSIIKNYANRYYSGSD